MPIASRSQIQPKATRGSVWISASAPKLARSTKSGPRKRCTTSKMHEDQGVFRAMM